MISDFTLRGVVLQDFRERPEDLYDLTFHKGRLAKKQLAPAGAVPNLYLTPGFRDAHVHMLHVGLANKRCDLSGTKSLEEALARITEYRAKMKSEERVIWGWGWDESCWDPPVRPTLEAIDSAVSDRPVIMRRICGHQAILNSPALHEAGLHWDMLDPAGCLNEEQAMMMSGLWPPSRKELEEAFREAQSIAIRMGIVRVDEMGARGALDTYLGLQRQGDLKIEVNLFVPPDLIERVLELRDEGIFNGPKLRLGGIKIFTDGSVGARTAAFSEPYTDQVTSGKLLLSTSDLTEILVKCRRSNLNVAAHAIGDAAIAQVISAAEKAVESGGLTISPFWLAIEHGELVPEGALEKISRLGITMSMQPNFVAQWSAAGGLYDTALGPERARRLNNFKEVIEKKIPLHFGSDGMPVNPALGLHGAVNHPNPDARLSPREALEIYLGETAPNPGFWEVDRWWQLGADRAVLYSSDPMALSSGDLSDAHVRAVLSNGEWILPPPQEFLSNGIIHAG